MNNILIEAATFADYGGWVVDTQSFETQKSAYLMAHGIGVPVADAETGFDVPQSGRFNVFVRTRNWSSVWNRGDAAGIFQLKIDGCALENIAGAGKSVWHWHFAGNVFLEAGQHTLSLHDLTGFNGRCEAVYFTADANDIPPDGGDELDRFRTARAGAVSDDPEQYDLLVCGGGYAGICTALAAKFSGLKVKLLQDRPVLGGCGSSEVRVWAGGGVNHPPYPALGTLAAQISPITGSPGMPKHAEYFEDKRKELLFVPEKELLLNEVVYAVETAPDAPRRISAVLSKNLKTGKLTRRCARYFSDCTGDALLSRLAGCTVMYGTEGHDVFNELSAPEKGSSCVMGHSVLWEVEKTEKTSSFPDINWGIEFTEHNALFRTNCCWDWECGQFRDQVKDIEYIRDYGLMTCFANWSFLKNRSSRKTEWEKLRLSWISPIGGKRESYRVKGDYILTQSDFEENTIHADGTGCATWSVDLHLPDPENREKFPEPFQSCAYHHTYTTPYPVPYRTLYAADADNLFLGGRCISLSHAAFSRVRVMRTLGMLGEVCGIAAALCVKYECSPRQIYLHHLQELQNALSTGISLPLPGSGIHRVKKGSYHFMRPVGSAGNADGEDCWYDVSPDGEPLTEIPESMLNNIRKLGINFK